MELSERLRAWRANIEGDFVAAVEAQRFVEMVRRDHPDEFDEWLTTHAVQFVTTELTRHDRNIRARLVMSARDHAFGDRDPDALGLFAAAFVIDTQNTRRPLGQMTGKDLRFRAQKYRMDSRHKAAMAMFLEVLAKKAGDRRVCDVMSEQRAAELMAQYVGHEAVAAMP